jgi:hypothetical protein
VYDVTFDVYGVSVRLRSPLAPFAEFVSQNYSQFEAAASRRPSIDVEFSEEAGRRAITLKSGSQFFGGGINVDGNSIFWENEYGFRVLVTIRQDGTLEVQAFHHNLNNNLDAEEQYKDFQRSLRWAVHFPIFTWLQYRRGWTLVHASAVVKDGEAIGFCGLNKVGKSTIAVYLAEVYGYDLMTDNFLLIGDKKVYGFPEVLRLSPETAGNMGFTSLWNNPVYGKFHIAPEQIGVELEGTPKAFFMINQANNLVSRPLHPSRAWETMNRLHSHLGEFPEHSYLGFWPYVTGETMNTETAARTLKMTQWYELSYKPDWNLDAIATEVERCI